MADVWEQSEQMKRLLIILSIFTQCTAYVMAQTDWGPFHKVYAVDGSQAVRWKTFYNPARDNDSNWTWSGDSIHLRVVKGDEVSFQLVIEGGTVGVDSINVLLDYLKDDAGHWIINTSAACTTFAGRYVQSYMLTHVYCDTRAFSIYWDNAYPLPDTAYLGWVPRHLVPLEAARKFIDQGGGDTTQGGAGGRSGPGFKVFPGHTNTIWFDVFVPRTTTAGTYHGNVKIVKTSRADTLFSIPIDLHVYNFALSDTMHARYYTALNNVGLAARAGVTMGTSYYWNTYWPRVQQWAHRHRMDINYAQEKYDTLKARRMGYFSGWRFTPSQGYEGPGQGYGQNIYIAALWNVNFANWWTNPGFRPEQAGDYTDDSSGWTKMSYDFEKIFQDSASHVLRSIELIDECLGHDDTSYGHTGEQPRAIDSVARWVRSGTSIGNKIHLFIPYGWMDPWVVNFKPAAGWFGAISMYGQKPNAANWGFGYNTRRYNPPYKETSWWTVEDVIDSGASNPTPTIVGTYHDGAGYMPNFQGVDMPLVYPRLSFWVVWEYQLSFLWWWTINDSHGDAGWNCWTDLRPDMGESDDGQGLAYGRDVYFSSEDRGVNVPIANVNMKAMRDGCRDYELLYECNRRGLLDTNWINRAGIWAAFNDFRYAQHQLDGPPSWAQTGYLVEGLRREMMEALDQGEEPPAGSTTRLLLRR